MIKLIFPLFVLGLSATSGLAQSSIFFPVGTTRVDLETDGLFSGDIDIVSSRLAIEQTRGPWRFRGRVSRVDHRVDYTPTFVTSPVTRREDAQSYDLLVERTLSPEFALIGTVSYGQGYADHRSIWISEFYDQFNRLNPAYREADPGFFSGSLGLQWNYDPGRSFVSLTFAQTDTNIVPGWETRVDGLTGDAFLFSADDTLRTFGGTLIWNAAVNSRLRLQQTVRIGRTDTRRIRTQVQSELAYAMTDDLTCRLQVGGAHEDPTLIARYGGATLVYDFSPQWQANLSYRYYEDTGEVNTANFNTAAPGLVSREIAAGLRWSNGSTSVLASVGLYETDFESVQGTGNVFFSGLFRDRSFTAVRLAITHKF